MRRATLVTTMLVAVLALMVPHAANASSQYSARYVVAPIQGGGDDVALPSPLPNLAPVGTVTVIPQGTTLTVTVHDDVMPNGHFLFNMCQRNEPDPGDSYCGQGVHDRTTGDICYDGPETLDGITPGNPVEITLWFATSPCPDSATTGTITVDSDGDI